MGTGESSGLSDKDEEKRMRVDGREKQPGGRGEYIVSQHESE